MNRAPSRASPSAEPTASNAAILGAATAFARPGLNTRTSSNVSHLSVGGALSAAGASNARSRSPVPPDIRAFRGRNDNDINDTALATSGLPRLLPPAGPQRENTKSPSQHAASVAASRAPAAAMIGKSNADTRTRTQIAQRPAPPPKPRRLSSSYSSRSLEGENEQGTDDTPIPSTPALVDLFERKASLSKGSTSKRPPPDPIVIAPSPDLPLKSPQPIRTSGGITTMFHIELDNANEKKAAQTSPDLRKVPPAETENIAWDANTRSFKPKGEVHRFKRQLSAAQKADEEHSPEGISPPVLDRDTLRLVTERSAGDKHLPTPSARSPGLPISPSYISAKPSLHSSNVNNSTSDPVKIQNPISHSGNDGADMNIPSSLQSAASVTAQYHQLYNRKIAPSMTGDQLADAMVASSLASSRTSSPYGKLEPPLPPSRRHKHRLSFSRTPSPAAKVGMLQTLRKVDSESSDDEDDLHPYSKHKKEKHRIVRKHPHKHHEGDRKRWREAVTERERKRYEGVWAANKGLHCSFTLEEQRFMKSNPDAPHTYELETATSDQVSNLAVREIWSRSRLPQDTLEMVWDLVDNDAVGRLSKEEFVVGLWLIDQRLKGRKLPVKVSESVWASVRGLQGIKIRKSIK